MLDQPPTLDPSDEPRRSSPRAFAIGTGRVLQTAGVLLFVGAFVLWAFGHRWIPRFSPPPVCLADYFKGPNFVRMVVGLNLAAAIIGGLGLFAAGIGLAGEQRGSGRAAIGFTGLLAAFYIVSALAFVWETAWFAAGVASLIALGMGILLLLALDSAATLRRNPPPLDQSAVTDEVLERLRRERDERRKKHDI